MQGKLKTKEKHKHEIALNCYDLALAQQRIKNTKNTEEKRLMWQDTETLQEAAERRKTAAQQNKGSAPSREWQDQHLPAWLMTGLQTVTRELRWGWGAYSCLVQECVFLS